MKFLTAALALLSVFSANASGTCSGFNKDDLLQSGVVEFANKDKSKTSCVTVQINYKIPSSGFQTAVSTSDISKYRPKSGLDYSVRAGRKDNSNALALSLIVEDKEWTKISVSYLVSSRNDLYIGSFIADTFSLFGCDKTKVDQGVISHTIQDLPQIKGKYKVQLFISGIKTDDGSASVSLWEPLVHSHNGLLTFNVRSDANPSIQNLHINYVIWQTVPFDISRFNPNKNSGADYQLIGISQFSKSYARYFGLGLDFDRLTCIGGGCKSDCTSTKQCKNHGGKVVGDSCFICGPFEKFLNNKCIPNCGANQIFDQGKCICKEGFIKIGPTCQYRCGVNEIWKNKKCICKQEHAVIDGVCRKCPSNSSPSNDGKQCFCKKDHHWNKKTKTCDYLTCPKNSEVVFQNNKFVCACVDGYRDYYGKCEKIIECPPRSVWNQKKLQCQCTKNGEYLIKNQCQPCGKYEGWNGQKCVCRTGYHQIKGVCRTCDPNSYYNGRDCVCNHGFFGDADKCSKCHESCGKCSGTSAKDCLTCSDVSYDLVDGYCNRNSPCPTGLYLDGKQCKPCSSYCSSCESENVCTTCIQGFKLSKLEFYGQKASFCEQICGDGKRFEVDCDDGNKKSGDGCSKDCQVEKGFTCQGGSSIKPSQCVSFAPSRSFITLKGSVHLFGKVVQGIRMTYLPPELTKNNCAECSKLLWVRVIDSQVVPGVRIQYLPNSKYQFLVEFEFHGLFAIPVFSTSFQINPDFSKDFSESDMAQIKIKTVDPAVLAIADQNKNQDDGSLRFDQIILGDQDIQKIFD